MPVRATKRGPERTPLHPDWDVIVCGASFAGLAVCRELAGSGARVLMLDPYPVAERHTTAPACLVPTRAGPAGPGGPPAGPGPGGCTPSGAGPRGPSPPAPPAPTPGQ